MKSIKIGPKVEYFQHGPIVGMPINAIDGTFKSTWRISRYFPPWNGQNRLENWPKFCPQMKPDMKTDHFSVHFFSNWLVKLQTKPMSFVAKWRIDVFTATETRQSPAYVTINIKPYLKRQMGCKRPIYYWKGDQAEIKAGQWQTDTICFHLSKLPCVTTHPINS